MVEYVKKIKKERPSHEASYLHYSDHGPEGLFAHDGHVMGHVDEHRWGVETVRRQVGVSRAAAEHGGPFRNGVVDLGLHNRRAKPCKQGMQDRKVSKFRRKGANQND